MKVVVAGSRTITDKTMIEGLIRSVAVRHYDASEIVSGGARGVDSLAQEIAKDMEIPFVLFPAMWDEFGKSAGYLRNQEMAAYGDCLLAIWDGESKGTKHMVDIMHKAGKPYHLVRV